MWVIETEWEDSDGIDRWGYRLFNKKTDAVRWILDNINTGEILKEENVSLFKATPEDFGRIKIPNSINKILDNYTNNKEMEDDIEIRDAKKFMLNQIEKLNLTNKDCKELGLDKKELDNLKFLKELK